ncbi:MAG: lipoyl(octanoyl) transferase LipB [Planctomycetota bacterium]
MSDDTHNDVRRLHISGPRRLDYEEAFHQQQDLVNRCVESGGRDNFLMLVEHPPVITVGRSGELEEVVADEAVLRERGVEVVETNRGGRATYHGPGQLVMYPVIDLKARGRDLHRYLRDLETWMVELLHQYDVEAHADSEHTGVWVGDDKIVSIGIAVRRWVSYHGVALNVNNDMSFFDLIVPCGLPEVRMISLSEEVGGELNVEDVAGRAARLFASIFDFEDSSCYVRDET